jgi:hypothetical protein
MQHNSVRHGGRGSGGKKSKGGEPGSPYGTRRPGEAEPKKKGK